MGLSSTRLPGLLVAFALIGALAALPAGAAAKGPGGEFHRNIIGGSPAAAGQWPSIAAVQADDRFCGGSLVASRWVLTAAHCVVREDGSVIPASSTVVAPGALKISSPGEVIQVAQTIPHPGYTPGTGGAPSGSGNDIALLRLDQDSGRPTMALIPPGDDPLVAAGRAARIAGWGCTGELVGSPPSCPSGDQPDTLQQASVEIISGSSCAAFGPDFIPSQMVCTGLGLPNVCSGDSGGPLTITGSAGRPVQVGIVSFTTSECGASYARSAYSRVSAFRSWIAGHIDIAVPGAPAVSFSRGPSQGQVTVTWRPPAGDGGSTITGYRVSRSPGGASVTLGPTARRYTFRGLDVRTKYAFSVRAQNAAGEGSRGTTTSTLPAIDTRASFGRPSAGRLAATLRRGIRERVRCSERCSVTIELRVSARTASRYGLGARRIVGSARATLRGGRTTAVTARFTPQARSRLRRARSVRITVVSGALSSGHLAVTGSHRITVRR